MAVRKIVVLFLAALGTCHVGATAASNGIVLLDLAGNSADNGSYLAVGPSGRIYAGGNYFLTPSIGAEPNASGSFLLALDGNGTLVPTFGVGGRIPLTYYSLESHPIVRTDDSVAFLSGLQLWNYDGIGANLLQADPDMYADLAVQSDGKYVVFGAARQIATPIEWTLKRFNTDGSYDTTLMGSGTVTTSAGGPVSNFRVISLANGQILGASVVRGTGGAVVVVRFNNDGTLDTTFGTNGEVSLPLCSCDLPADIALDSSAHKIYVAAGSGSLLTRLNDSDGSVDSTFPVIPAIPNVMIRHFTLDGSGRIVFFGTINPPAGGPGGYVARFLANGAADASFGTAGGTTIHIGGSSQISNLADGLSQPDGKLVALLTTAIPSDTPSNENLPLESAVTDIAIARLNADGTPDTTFGASQPDSDVYPDAFTVTADTAPHGTTSVVSSPVTITGITSATSVALVSGGGDFSVGCTGTYTATRALISNGQALCVRHSASAQAGGTATTVIDVGGREAAYTTTSSTTEADTTPDPFSFTAKTGTELGVDVESDPVTITGLTGAAPIIVQNGSFAIGCGGSQTGTTTGSITNGQTICAVHQAAQTNNTVTTTTLIIGGVSAQFTSTTADTTPDAFSFTAQTGVATGATVTSNTITITGITGPTPVSITGGKYSIGCTPTFTNQNGTINPDQAVCVQQTAASAASTDTTSTLTVGGVSASFKSTTATAMAATGSGGGGSAGVIDLLLLSGFLGLKLVLILRTSARAV